MSRRSASRLEFIPPLIPTLVDQPPEGEGWIHEVKFDGYRAQIVIDSGGARVFTHNDQVGQSIFIASFSRRLDDQSEGRTIPMRGEESASSGR
jgi:hypothetical protein